MNDLSNPIISVPHNAEVFELHRLVPAASPTIERNWTSSQDAASGEPRIFQLDARFDSAGTWAGVEQLTELAYLGLLEMGEDAILERHRLELYMVLPKYRDGIHPKYLSLTDTAIATERTRFYALDRAYRLVHGLVGLILQWQQALRDRNRWVIMVRNFDHAQHLATRFFGELARRSASESQIEVIIESRSDWPGLARRLPGLQAVPAARWISELAPNPIAPRNIGDAGIAVIENGVADGGDKQLEQKYPALLDYYRSSGDGLAAARIALKMFIIYNSYGYYHEAKSFMDAILPYFDRLVGNDETQRIHYVSRMNICLVQTDDPAGALNVVGELAAAHLTKPYLLAGMNYILGMHYLRYAESKDIHRAEEYISRAVDYIHAAKDSPELREYPFQKVFIDNGLAFLRARQGRHQEALDLCETGFEFLTRELGEDRHLLHRSVLQYNIAQVYVMLGRLDEGLEHYRHAIRMDPNYSEYYNEIGNIVQEQGLYQGAIEYYQQAIERSAPYPEVYFNKAVCHARLEQPEDAITCFDISLELNPNQPESYALRADLLRELGKDQEALDGYNTAIALGYDSAPLRVNRAVLHYNIGAFELALSDMNHVIDFDAQEATHYENRAAIYRAMNRDDLYLRDIGLAERCRELA